MKRLFINYRVCLYIVFISLNLSCKKSNPSSGSVTPDPGFVEFKINGSAVKIIYSNYAYRSPLFFQKIPPPNIGTHYSLNGSELNSNIELNIFTDSLETKNYHYDSLDVAHSYNDILVISLRVTYNGQTSYIHYKDDFADFNISSYKNSRVSGTFMGKLTPKILPTGFGEASSINIAEGKINDVKVIY
jgi:hypothetical protein